MIEYYLEPSAPLYHMFTVKNKKLIYKTISKYFSDTNIKSDMEEALEQHFDYNGLPLESQYLPNLLDIFLNEERNKISNNQSYVYPDIIDGGLKSAINKVLAKSLVNSVLTGIPLDDIEILKKQVNSIIADKGSLDPILDQALIDVSVMPEELLKIYAHRAIAKVLGQNTRITSNDLDKLQDPERFGDSKAYIQKYYSSIVSM